MAGKLLAGKFWLVWRIRQTSALAQCAFAKEFSCQ
jgi:hypothetical protein